MKEHERPDQEPENSSSVPNQPVPKRRRALSIVKRELTDEEFRSPAARKLLIDELERLEVEVSELAGFREQFYQREREIGVLQERLRTFKSLDIISTGCLAVGAAALGYAPSVWSQQPTGFITLGFGAILIIAGIWAKAVQV